MEQQKTEQQEYVAEDFMRIEDLAKYLRVGMKRAREIEKMPGFPKFRVGNRYIYPRDKVKEYIEERSDFMFKANSSGKVKPLKRA